VPIGIRLRKTRAKSVMSVFEVPDRTRRPFHVFRAAHGSFEFCHPFQRCANVLT
jgi:hypothetical protein